MIGFLKEVAYIYSTRKWNIESNNLNREMNIVSAYKKIFEKFDESYKNLH